MIVEEKKKRKVTAIVLAAGRGSRMESRVKKQYLELEGRPLICHAQIGRASCRERV